VQQIVGLNLKSLPNKNLLMKRIQVNILIVLFLLLPTIAGNAQFDTAKKRFTLVKNLAATPVKNQYRTGTCWSFGAVSFLESELLRMGKGSYDLSEMYFVHLAYPIKADRFVRMHGKANFGCGGFGTDVLSLIKNYGVVPEEAYSGLKKNEANHNHEEMDEALNKYISTIASQENNLLTPKWNEGFEGILDAYLGKIPDSFSYKGLKHTPKSFAASLPINPDDYILLSSYTHHPFYSQFILEVPDNWSWTQAYNIPIEDMMEILNYSLDNNYTILWDTDNSNKGFSNKYGLAILPNNSALPDSSIFEGIINEKPVDQKLRQEGFDDYDVQDDHFMHITGYAKDANGKIFYLVKNSWGTEGNPYNGYIYASESYVRYYTISILVNRKAIPQVIAEKLKL
jgi:bleomycin hydrolase